MLKQLRIRFVAVAMLSMLIITTLLVGTINIVNYVNEKKVINNTIDFIALNGGALRRTPWSGNGSQNGNRTGGGTNPDEGIPNSERNGSGSMPGTPEDNPENNDKIDRMAEKMEFGKEAPYTTRFFAAYFDSEGECTRINAESIAAYTEDESKEIAQKLFNAADKDKIKKDGDYFYTVKAYNDGYLFIYMDCSETLKSSRRLLFVSLIVAAVSLILELVIITLFSKRVVKPAVENIERQKRFITDASHELKTPLTIISANTEVLELMNGEDEWTDSIKNQTVRMTKLVNEMVSLAKMDEERTELTMSSFSLSEAVSDMALPFKTVAESGGFTYNAEIEPGISWTGDEAAVRQMLSIFLDNAVKYTAENGSIDVKLYRKGHHSTLTVANSCAPISKDELSKLFERFYRTDKSRSRETGGSGIGLSIAKAIADAHKNMDLSVSSPKEKYIEFKVRFK